MTKNTKTQLLVRDHIIFTDAKNTKTQLLVRDDIITDAKEIISVTLSTVLHCLRTQDTADSRPT
jgi:hypothetical protein